MYSMFSKVLNKNEIDTVVKLAYVIWTDHYTPMLEPGQTEYMLKNYHSKNIISKQIENENYHYFLIKNQNQNIGYIGVQLNTDHLFISKIYISSQTRGKGYGKLAMNFIKNFAAEHNREKIKLTVNKKNIKTIAAYYKLGFIKTAEMCIDIGGGYFMDDYEMCLIN